MVTLKVEHWIVQLTDGFMSRFVLEQLRFGASAEEAFA